MNIIQSEIDKINNLYGVLDYSLKKTVGQAIELGKALQVVKNNCKHGEWEKLFANKIKFHVNSAKNFMLIAKYSNKTTKNVDLQSALIQAKQIETDKKQKEQGKRQTLINEKNKTGNKPAGWDRACEYEFNKQTDDNAYQKRKNEAIENKKTNYIDTDNITDNAFKILDTMQERLKKFENMVEAVGGDEDIFAILEGYLSKLETKERKHEFCNTIIKYLKEKAIKFSIT